MSQILGIIGVLLTGLMSTVELAFGQSVTHRHTLNDAKNQDPVLDSVDFTGLITDFDRDFNGIGPRVYYLPAPPSQEELLSRQFQNKQHEMIPMDRMLSKASILGELRDEILPHQYVFNTVGPEQSIEGWLLMEIERLNEIGDLAGAAELYHLLAYEYFRLGALEQAFAYYEMALTANIEQNRPQDVQAIRQSLAMLYEYEGDLQCAAKLYSGMLDDARRWNHGEVQARSLLRLAFIKALQGKHYEAEQDLIRIVEPMFRRMRNSVGDKGRIITYRTLADVYRLQNRHPEAQWFLLQAKEVIDNKNLNQYLPLILFDLAEVKRSSGNTQVAINEYLLADQLAGTQADDLVLKLAIQEALGDIYHGSGHYKEALEALNRYDTLKSKLISLDFPF